jgi:hypothetical protein
MVSHQLGSMKGAAIPCQGPSAKGIHRGHVGNLLVRLQTSSRIARAYGSIRVIVEAQYIACAPSVESLSIVIETVAFQDVLQVNRYLACVL